MTDRLTLEHRVDDENEGRLESSEETARSVRLEDGSERVKDRRAGGTRVEEG